MRRLFTLASLLLLAALSGLGAGRALANQPDSQAWFLNLSADDRTNIQRSLILSGNYDALVDGQFGPDTYRGLVAYQSFKGDGPTGVLDRDQFIDLLQDADAVYRRFGFDLVRDEAADIALAIPLTLLPMRAPVSAFGTRYDSSDAGVRLVTQRYLASDRKYTKLYLALTAPVAGTTLTYKIFTDKFFVVSGTTGSERFYSLFQNDGSQSVGYTVSWTPNHDTEGGLLAVLAASYSTPLDRLPAPPSAAFAPASGPNHGVHYGSFFALATVPPAIALGDDITATTAADFEAALAANPSVRLLVLDSRGGNVIQALAVAEMVHKRRLHTLVLTGSGCYSACAYIFFAGVNRQADGDLGVHQVSGDGVNAAGAQVVLSMVLDGLNTFGVSEGVISAMLSTLPSDIHIFSPYEIVSLGINKGRRVTLLSKVAANAELAAAPDMASASDSGQ